MFRERAIETLKKKGFKITKPRVWIVEFLHGNTSHPSATEIYEQLRIRNKNFSFATVYNTVDTLVKSGIIKQVTADPKCARFDYDVSSHGHFYCKECGSVHDLFEIDVEVNDKVGDIESFELTATGKCSKCIKGGN